jgi:hypothetical protein
LSSRSSTLSACTRRASERSAISVPLQLEILVPPRAYCGKSSKQTRPAQRPQLAAQRLRAGDKQSAQLAEPRLLGGQGARTGDHQRTQRLAPAACARSGELRLAEHAARRGKRIECIALRLRAALAAQAADLEHTLPARGQEAAKPGSIGARALDRPGTATGCIPLGDLKRLRVALRARGQLRLSDKSAAFRLDERE